MMNKAVSFAKAYLAAFSVVLVASFIALGPLQVQPTVTAFLAGIPLSGALYAWVYRV